MMSKLRSGLAVVAMALALGACGGGGGGVQDTNPPGPAGPTSVDMVPPGASVSVVTYTAFAQSLSSSEWTQPLGMDQVVPPTSESALPVALK